MAAGIAESPNVNTLWGRVIADELARCGVRYALISPGSRSTPLTLAVAAHPDITDISILDERSAAFFALGVARELRLPAVLVCTSGTAAANYYPAVCEARASRIPLLVLTADRPPHLHDAGAPQTMDQERLFGVHAKWFAGLPQPEADEFKLRALRSTIAYACAQAGSGPAGPVHLNVPLRKPLEPADVPEGHHAAISEAQRRSFGIGAYGRDGGARWESYERPARGAPDARALLDLLGIAQRPLILAGPDMDGGKYAGALVAFAEAYGIPVFAEGISNVRFMDGEHPLVIGCADIMLRSGAFRAACMPDLIIRTGAAPTNNMLQDFAVVNANAVQVRIGLDIERRDPEFLTERHIIAEPGAVFEAAAGSGRDYRFEDGWSGRLTNAAAHARSVLSEALDDIEGLTEPGAFHKIASLLPRGTAVMLSNSMPVRDWETWAQPSGRPLAAYCNRGVNGIDGVTSTALGMARARGGKTVLVTGDLAFLHDLNGLWAAREGGVNATIIVINNNGGEIFRMLPVRTFEPPFRKHFTTPHNMDLAKAGKLFDIEFFTARNAYQLQTFMNISLDAPGLQIIEIPTGRERETEIRKAVTKRVTDILDGVLASPQSAPPANPVYPVHMICGKETDTAGRTPALLLHGFTRATSSWDPVVRLLPRERNIYLADLMGHGASAAPRFENAPEAYALHYQCDRIENRLRQQGIERLHLAGYSMGGRTALLYALEHPERIASLTLISASPGIEDEAERTVRAGRDRELAESIVTGGLEAFVDAWSSSDIVAQGLDETTRREARRERLMQRAEGLRGSLLGMGQGVQPNLWDRLGELRMPVLLVYGSGDEKYVRIMRDMAGRIPEAQHTALPETGHDVVSAAPEELASLLRGFWDVNEEAIR